MDMLQAQTGTAPEDDATVAVENNEKIGESPSTGMQNMNDPSNNMSSNDSNTLMITLVAVGAVVAVAVAAVASRKYRQTLSSLDEENGVRMSEILESPNIGAPYSITTTSPAGSAEEHIVEVGNDERESYEIRI